MYYNSLWQRTFSSKNSPNMHFNIQNMHFKINIFKYKIGIFIVRAYYFNEYILFKFKVQ